MSNDYDEIIHSDTRNGDVVSLEIYLDYRSECINQIYEYGQSKWTILLAACYYKHEDVVRMLLTRFKPNIEVQGTVIMTDEGGSTQIIEGASPLWAAAAVNHFGIVKLLVEYGQANINHLSKEHSTPLRAACYCGNLEIVRYLIEHGANPHQTKLKNDTNLMLSAYRGHIDLVKYFMDELKCDVNQQDEDGRTVLHDAIENNFIEITEFLIQRGALNFIDTATNMTPLMLAAVRGKKEFVVAFDGYYTDLEWIEANELLGSAFAGCEVDIEDLNQAVELLTLALESRITKNLPKRLSAQALEIFDYRQECETLQQLHQLVSSGSDVALYIEALLIRERLLGTISENYRNSIRYIGATLAESNQYDICLRLWFYELDLRRQHDIPFDRQAIRLFDALYGDIYVSNYIHSFIDPLLKVLMIVENELSLRQNQKDFDYNLITLLHLISISARVLFNTDQQSDHKAENNQRVLFQHIRSIVHKKYSTIESDSSLLHLCCDDKTESLDDVVNYPCTKTVRLLVLCGVDVDAMNSARNTALHILAQNIEQNNTMIIIDFLCDGANAHKDFVNNDGKVPVECKSIQPFLADHHEIVNRLRQKIGVTSLKCQSARLIKRDRVPYENYLSPALTNFVDKH